MADRKEEARRRAAPSEPIAPTLWRRGAVPSGFMLLLSTTWTRTSPALESVLEGRVEGADEAKDELLEFGAAGDEGAGDRDGDEVREMERCLRVSIPTGGRARGEEGGGGGEGEGRGLVCALLRVVTGRRGLAFGVVERPRGVGWWRRFFGCESSYGGRSVSTPDAVGRNENERAALQQREPG